MLAAKFKCAAGDLSFGRDSIIMKSNMSSIIKSLDKVSALDKNFIGTITFRSEEITLPDGSKMALGIDDGHWVLVYQKSARGNFVVFNYVQADKKLTLDQKPGSAEDLKIFNNHLNYFLSHANVNDLVTLVPTK